MACRWLVYALFRRDNSFDPSFDKVESRILGLIDFMICMGIHKVALKLIYAKELTPNHLPRG